MGSFVIGVSFVEMAKNLCASKKDCAGVTTVLGGINPGWALVYNAKAVNGIGGSPGNTCIVAPGKSLAA
jgi:hypothetical protein